MDNVTWESEQTRVIRKAQQEALQREQRKIDERLRYLEAMRQKRARCEEARKAAIAALREVMDDPGMPKGCKAAAEAGQATLNSATPTPDLIQLRIDDLKIELITKSMI